MSATGESDAPARAESPGGPSLRVNGETRSLQGWQGRRLLDYLRAGLGLTGSKEGCGEGECGACTVLLEGQPVCSCLVFTDTAAGRDVRTVEGVDPALLDLLAIRIETSGGVQCGFCTPGFMVMAQWLSLNPELSREARLEKLLEGNLCRCTGYRQLVAALSDLPAAKSQP